MATVAQLTEWIKSNKLVELQKAFEQQPALASETTAMGVSLLQFAAYCRNQAAISCIRSSLEAIDFYEAASVGEVQTIQKQLAENPELLNGHGSDGFSALGLACFFGHTAVVAYLLQEGADPNIAAANAIGVYPIHSACAVSNYDITARLLKAGASPNVKQQKDITPLHSAAHNGQLALAQLLLRYGADRQAKTTDGQTPADMALEAGFEKVSAFLA